MTELKDFSSVSSPKSQVLGCEDEGQQLQSDFSLSGIQSALCGRCLCRWDCFYPLRTFGVSVPLFVITHVQYNRILSSHIYLYCMGTTETPRNLMLSSVVVVSYLTVFQKWNIQECTESYNRPHVYVKCCPMVYTGFIRVSNVSVLRF